MQPTLPIVSAWPALLGTDTACLYLSLERRQFERLAERWRITPVDTGENTTLWRRTDLDVLIKRLPASALSPVAQPVPTVKLDRATVEQIVDALATRLGSRHPAATPFTPQFLSIRDTCLRLGLSRSTINRMIAEGKLRVRRFGTRTLVTVESIEAMTG
ncbi:helix-turn-helix domain-containing protein [Novosphingobium aerophilum]|uniref:Helix-turn-helix domain-containing protein n=1 Tax=Novosphingobium aerophilum TaxID=2839843 RepID=A0A7X1FAV8_9SPHN|nr:helix-turn-helix domain-containing protein [Novosphingobium aerophilum]MBC2653610.1 helix-turn-helix domain-containing protein [Novosphingobium aerophilum]